MAFRLPLLGNVVVPMGKPDPEVAAALNRRFQLSNGLSLYGIFPFVALMLAVFWSRSDHTGLLVWAGVMTAVATVWLFQIGRPIDDSWVKRCAPFQLLGAFSWSLFTLIAMPEDEASQVLVVACLTGVIAANTNSSAPLRLMFYRFHLTLCVASALGLFVNATGAGLWTGLPFLGFSFVYASGMAEVNHVTHREAAEFGVQSRRLAEGLEVKQVQLKKANEKLDLQARTDPLTGITNRLGLDEAIDQALRRVAWDPLFRVELAFIDLDAFKAVNDTLGHLAGDQLLMSVTNRLSSVVREGETVARQGGDELVILSSSIGAPGEPSDATKDLSERISSVFATPFAIKGRVLELSASCGIAVASPTMDADELLRQADLAVYKSKTIEGTVVVVFEPELEREPNDTLRLSAKELLSEVPTATP